VPGVLPIESVLDAVIGALHAHRSLVLQAPPGAGKTTLVPPALLGAHWLGARSILMLEPRRLATRAAAERIAHLRGERVGGTVGYRMRGESRVGRDTRIEIVTEGILARRLQRDPILDGVGVVIFDEFHERSLDADLGLALTLRTQQLVRDDLRIIVMSATLDGESVAALLGGAPIISSSGRVFPIETRYIERRADARIEASVVSTIGAALANDDGDMLVFLPGAAEIRRVASALDARDLRGAIVAPLYGAMPRDAQDRALQPDASGQRKIVLATSIAETSLTIEGVRVVIDSGLSRQPRFSPRTGMTRLETTRVSRASADQRRGRAGRLGPGVCYRLWPEHENAHLLANTPAEILSADLAPLALELAAAGVVEPLELEWLDAPSPSAYAQARELLRELDALDASGALTAHGREMASLPIHPRLAHMVLRARSLGATALACEVAALLSERDIIRGTEGPIDADIALRVDALRRDDGWVAPAGAHVDRDAVRRARSDAERLARQLDVTLRPPASLDRLGVLVALAYPDRVAQRRSGTRSRFVLRNGRGAELQGAQTLFEHSYLAVAELDDQRPESRVFLAAAITLEEIRAAFGEQISIDDVVEFDDASSSVVARRRERLGAIVLREVASTTPDPATIRRALVEGLRRRGVDALPWSDASRRLRQRIAFVARHESSWPDVSDAVLEARLDEWLGPSLDGVRRLGDVERVGLGDALASMLDWKQRRQLDELAPTHIEVPSGSRIPVDYSDPSAPVLAVRIQEVFGMTESPRLAGNRVPVTMHLLSPAHRPVQVTQDLAGFWRTSYFDVRKDLRGRYPKHDWPENPLAATPTKRVKRRPSS
jgi:ATP-dependent helicase HrpB